jgi:hypothetical protein
MQRESSVLGYSFSKPIGQEIFDLKKSIPDALFKVNTKLIEVIFPKIIRHT